MSRVGEATLEYESAGHLITGHSVIKQRTRHQTPMACAPLLLRNDGYQTPTSLVSPPCARYSRTLGAPRIARFANAPAGGWRFVFPSRLKIS
jgi:hypothetical protein